MASTVWNEKVPSIPRTMQASRRSAQHHDIYNHVVAGACARSIAISQQLHLPLSQAQCCGYRSHHVSQDEPNQQRRDPEHFRFEVTYKHANVSREVEIWRWCNQVPRASRVYDIESKRKTLHNFQSRQEREMSDQGKSQTASLVLILVANANLMAQRHCCLKHVLPATCIQTCQRQSTKSTYNITSKSVDLLTTQHADPHGWRKMPIVLHNNQKRGSTHNTTCCPVRMKKNAHSAPQSQSIAHHQLVLPLTLAHDVQSENTWPKTCTEVRSKSHDVDNRPSDWTVQPLPVVYYLHLLLPPHLLPARQSPEWPLVPNPVQLECPTEQASNEALLGQPSTQLLLCSAWWQTECTEKINCSRYMSHTVSCWYNSW